MTISTEDLLNSILSSLGRIEYIKVEDIPGIDLYMDQVTTFMDKKMRSATRKPDEDKILTKTMINNYAKNDLLPPPIRKKYNKEHILLLIFIYYFKGILPMHDIQNLLEPLKSQFFGTDEKFNLESVYEEVFSMEEAQVEALKKDVTEKFKRAEASFAGAPKKSQEFLKQFTFICLLGFDVYVKKLMIEKMIDELAAHAADGEEKQKKE